MYWAHSYNYNHTTIPELYHWIYNVYYKRACSALSSCVH
ncbi:hypothetical protein GBAR_LOCUS7249 [Geodia barretti]|uniref:Uncharacterized protein n=1 Tax=Geodia barretti TaxID=519541 RepID=A0AA35RIA3_GEOBA|nr:hypothetical protein GBAR_LOCUS7249 [Geodia barretti]